MQPLVNRMMGKPAKLKLSLLWPNIAFSLSYKQSGSSLRSCCPHMSDMHPLVDSISLALGQSLKNPNKQKWKRKHPKIFTIPISVHLTEDFLCSFLWCWFIFWHLHNGRNHLVDCLRGRTWSLYHCHDSKDFSKIDPLCSQTLRDLAIKNSLGGSVALGRGGPCRLCWWHDHGENQQHGGRCSGRYVG